MKAEEMKNPEARDELVHENTEINLDSDGERITGGNNACVDGNCVAIDETYSFCNCTSLETITLPSGVEITDTMAFKRTAGE